MKHLHAELYRKLTRMTTVTLVSLTLVTLTLVTANRTQAQGDAKINQATDAIRKAGKEGTGFAQAIPAANRLRQTPFAKIDLLLDAMADINPIAENWMRGIVFDIARKSNPSPADATLQQYAMDRSNNPTGRGLAMELLQQIDPATASKLIAECLDDPSLPLREMAVEQAIQRAQKSAKDQPAAAIADYRISLSAARHPRQLSRIIEALGKLGEEVRTADAFVMLTDWKGLAPLNNVDGVGFDREYAPEKEFSSSKNINLSEQHAGKNGNIEWQSITGSAELGEVDLAAAYDKEKGAVGYLFTEFESDQDRPAQARLGCINANKVWINGELLMQNEVYHAGSMIDQYIANFSLKKGTNRILLKICQNEQEESWAQNWKFQFRITDPSGKGLSSKP